MFADSLIKAGVKDNVKVAMMPLDRNKVLLRFGNMIDQ